MNSCDMKKRDLQGIVRDPVESPRCFGEVAEEVTIEVLVYIYIRISCRSESLG